MINKLIFLYHSGSKVARGPITPGEGGTLAGLIFIGIILAATIGMWIYFTRKKKY